MANVLCYRNGGLEAAPADVVREFALKVVVNGRDIATLICSPHDLECLAAGFLRLQGFLESAEDLLSLGVCGESGVATAVLKGSVPERIPRVVTSSCGVGWGAPSAMSAAAASGRSVPPQPYKASEILDRMDDLSRLAICYKSHGGMHSSGVGDETSILLHAEDLGRHNTLDRIAGAALLKGIDLSGRMLVTSGRVPSETVAKAASLGISLIASRTSPTDQAVSAAETLGVSLVGYVRGGRFTVYAHPERVSVPDGKGRIRGITGVILAGGASRRMGSNKALLPYQGGRFIESVHRCLAEVFEETLVVTNTPEAFDFLHCRKVPDLLTGMGVLSGIHSGLCNSGTPSIFVVACDMPHLNPGLVRHLAMQSRDADVLVPESGSGVEPLHAVFHKRCIPPIEDALRAGERRIVSFFEHVRVRTVPKEEVARFDPDFRSFRNINTPEDYYRFRTGSDPAYAVVSQGTGSRSGTNTGS